ncbi:ATP-binding cassette domain-containing protein [bacterium]|nr:ATP-binding cassette domain-containing protein [bacterium]
MDNEVVITVANLRKTFQTFKRREGVAGAVKDLFNRNYTPLHAVDGINFQIKRGEILGFIGPNGAGKSTTIKMLTGILKATSGEMSVLGYDPFRDRKNYVGHIGVVFGQRTQLWWDIAVIESLKLLGKIYNVSDTDFKTRIELLTGVLDLKEFLNTPVRKLSLGQRIRSDLAASLIHSPQVLFLDEPTIGLDAVAKDSVREFLQRINSELKTTIILTTHDLREIEELCERIIIIDHGKIIFDGGIDRIKSLPGLTREMIVDFSGTVTQEELRAKLSSLVEIEIESSRRAQVRFESGKVPAAQLVRAVLDNFDVSDLSILQPPIEEVIMKIYREGIRE